MIDPKDVIRRYTVEELCETAEQYYRSVSDPTPLMSKPFSFLHETPEALQNLGLLLSPFAYFEVSVVDLNSGRVLRSERGLASDLISASGTDTGNPWDTLSGQQKVKKLTDMVRAELGMVMPKLLK